MLQLKKCIHLDSLNQPFKTAIITAAKLGADAIEINGRTEVRAHDMSRTAVRHIKKLLADVNLKVASVYFPTRFGYGDLDYLDQRIDATKATLSMAYELGCSVVSNRIGKIPADREDPRWITMVQALTDIGNHAQKAGAWLTARTGANDGETLKGLIDALAINHLNVDFDPAELVMGGHCPTEAIKVLATHVLHVRARDAVTDLSLGRGMATLLGEGSVDWSDLLGTLEQKSYDGYLTVQSEGDNGVAECSHAFDFLSKLF